MNYPILILSAFAMSACSDDGREPRVAPHTEEDQWGYAGEIGPAHWADLDPSFATCRDGVEQSPIDVSNAMPFEDSGLDRRIGETILSVAQRARVMDIINNGHTIQVTNDVPMTIDLGGTNYELVQFHFHAPSEHTIDGERSPLEVHFVHRSAEGELAVLGILVEKGEYNPLMQTILASLPDRPGDNRHLEDLDLDMNELRPLPQHYYRYKGSLTTPPCSEGVQWVIMADKREISSDQMADIVSRLHANFRPVQPIGERRIGLVSRD